METRKQPAINKKKLGPERKFFQELFGKRVIIDLVNSEEPFEGILLWVDRYTLGVRGKDKILIYKHAVESIQRHWDQEDSEDARGRDGKVSTP